MEIDHYKLVDGMVFRTAPARSPKVTVMDAYCKPLAGAKVFARQHYGLKDTEKPVGVTNSAGEMTVPAAYKGGVYTFRAVLPGYFGWGTKCPPVGGDSWIDSVEIVMAPAKTPEAGRSANRRQ
jgi:hypothetical protein